MKIRTLGLAGALACAAAAVAGGFWITTYSPQAPVAAKIANAAVVVAVEGCHDPTDATFSGTAEGLVNGKRQSVPLKFAPTSKPGVYAVQKQWPAGGAWLLSITATHRLGPSASMMIELAPNGEAKTLPAKSAMGKVSRNDLEAALQRLAKSAT